jgi:hypothetical protein
MSNTVIQIKRSTITSTPANLGAGEPAYSYLSDKLFIGDSSGSGVIEIGGRFYNNVSLQAYDTANAAFAKANTVAGGADEKANAALITANIAYDKANSANLLAYNTGIGANAYSTAVGIAANLYTVAATTAANSYAAVAATSANAYAAVVGSSANAYTDAATVAANSYATAAAVAANTYADQTFVKLTAPDQTITGNVSITGNITVAGNAFSIDTETLRVSDPLIYLAGNNYTSDIVDIGFIGNYVNSTGANVHTGLYREHVSKEYYLFQEYAEEPFNNHIDPTGNNFTLAVLNADVVTSNLKLGGQNTIVWINAAFNKANAAAISGNSAAVAANTYADAVGVSANAYATGVGVGANLYAATVGTSANLYTDSVGSAVGLAANTNAANGSYISTGVVKVAYGGTGQTTFTTNGVLYGNGGNALQVTGAGTEGQVLQANASGVPTFAMLDGGVF